MENEQGIVATVADSGQAVVEKTIDSMTNVGGHMLGAGADVNEHAVNVESGLVRKIAEGGQLSLKELGELIKDLTGHFADALKGI